MAYRDEPVHVDEDTTDVLRTQGQPVAGGGNGFGAPETGGKAQQVGDTARGEAAAVKSTVADAGAGVVETAKDQGAQVVGEARYQGRRLLDEGVSELRTQAGSAQERLAGFLRSMSDELQTMTSQGEHDGPVADLVRQAEHYGSRAAQWLESSSPEDVLSSVRRYAARNPWQFLAISAGAGFVAARLFRGLQAGESDQAQARGFSSASGYGAGYDTTGYTLGYGTAGYASGAMPAEPSGAMPAEPYGATAADRDRPYGYGQGTTQDAPYGYEPPTGAPPAEGYGTRPDGSPEPDGGQEWRR